MSIKTKENKALFFFLATLFSPGAIIFNSYWVRFSSQGSTWASMTSLFIFVLYIYFFVAFCGFLLSRESKLALTSLVPFLFLFLPPLSGPFYKIGFYFFSFPEKKFLQECSLSSFRVDDHTYWIGPCKESSNNQVLGSKYQKIFIFYDSSGIINSSPGKQPLETMGKWDYALAKSRADQILASNHRYVIPLTNNFYYVYEEDGGEI